MNNRQTLIEQARTQNLMVQLAQRRSRQLSQPLATIPTYLQRDPVTGQRQLQASDGGVEYARYLSNAMPEAIVLLPGAIGQAGTALQKPV